MLGIVTMVRKLAIRTKRHANEMVKKCIVEINGLSSHENLNIIPIGKCNVIVGMDWLLPQ